MTLNKDKLTKKEIELYEELTKATSKAGFYEGALMGILTWPNLPKDLKEKIKEVLNDKRYA